MSVGVKRLSQGRFTSGKDLLPLVQEADWALGPVWTGTENLAHTGFRTLDRQACSTSQYPLRYPADLRFISIITSLCP